MDTHDTSSLGTPQEPEERATGAKDANARPTHARHSATPGTNGRARADRTEAQGANGAQESTEANGANDANGAPIPSRQGTSLQERRAQRRRRRYVFYVRRNARTRQSSRATSLARAGWIAVAVLVALIAVLVSGTFGVAAAYYQSMVPAVNGLSHTVASKDSMRIYDTNGVLLYEFEDNGAQHSISISHIPVEVINATVAIEDRTFWTNQGVDFASMARAALADVSNGGITQGGSTITQQLIKQNILNSNETFNRKIREAVLALGITTTGLYSKQQILEMYLNSIPYGQEAYGIDEAAHSYFGYNDDPTTGETAAQHLDLAQASMLAGIPQNPNTNDPLLHPKAAHDRQLVVLSAMVTSGYITQAQAAAAAAESQKPNFYSPPQAVQNLAPHFVAFVKDQLDNMIATGQVHLSRSGLNVYTTLDINLQNHVQQYMKDHLYGWNRDDYGSYIRFDNVTNSAAVMADQHTGAIKVLLGSVDYNNQSIDGSFDVATQGYRSPGSSFKPIVYSAAFEKGWFPGMVIGDAPTVLWDAGRETTYKPLDFHPEEFLGNVTIREALQQSLNIPAIKTIQFVGIQDAMKWAERLGIHYVSPQVNGTPGLTTVIGSLDVTIYDMTQVYTDFANYGQYIPLYSIDHITDASGNVLYQYHTPQPVQVMSPQVAYMMTSILSDNVARAPEFGPCSPLYLDSASDCAAHDGQPSPNAYPNAAKTGTAQNFTDDFTMGYTMNYTMGVWAGNSNNTPMQRIDGVTGAAPIWYNSMMYAASLLPSAQAHQNFPVPSGLQLAKYTSDGVTSTDWFMAGPLPPSGIGNSAGAKPCISFNTDKTGTYDLNDPWRYCAAAPTATPGTGAGTTGGGGTAPPAGAHG